MPSSAIIVQYANPRTTATGFVFDLQVCVGDPAVADPPPRAITVTGVELPINSPATWKTTIKNAVIARANSIGFTDLVATSVYLPQFSA